MNAKSAELLCAGFAIGIVTDICVRKLHSIYKERSSHERSETASETKNIPRERSDQHWSTAYKDRVSEFLHNREYSNESEIYKSEISSKLENDSSDVVKNQQMIFEFCDGVCNDCFLKDNQAMSEDSSDVLSDASSEASDIVYADKSVEVWNTNDVVEISAKEFVKAAISGELIRSYIFDTSNHELYWNFTNELIDHDTRKDLGLEPYIEQMINDMASDGPSTKYLRDDTEETYVRIEPGRIIA